MTGLAIGDFAADLRRMADDAAKVAERHDVAQMASLRRQVEQQAAQAQRDSDLIAEQRRQVRGMGRALDGIFRLRKTVQSGDADVVQILADALLVLDGRCETFTSGSCRGEHSGRSRGARYLAEAWCGPCVARDALERAGLKEDTDG